MVKIGKTLVELRNKKGLTQDQMADLLGVKRPRYNAWENDISRPDIDMIDALAKAHQVTSDFILGRTQGASADSDTPEWATARDKRDLKKLLEDDVPIMFDGVPIEGDARQRVKDVLTGLFWEAKELNKQTYGRGKAARSSSRINGK